MFGADWADLAKRIVAQFRVTYDLWADDPAFVSLRQRLHEACPEFAQWWKHHEVKGSIGGTKIVRHPTKGTQEFVHASFQANDDPNLRLVIYSRA